MKERNIMTYNQQMFIQWAAQMIRLTSNTAICGTIGSGMSRKQVITATKEAVKQSGVKVKSAKLIKNAVLFTVEEAA